MKNASKPERDQLSLLPLLLRIATALERLAPLPPALPNFSDSSRFIWQGGTQTFHPVHMDDAPPLHLLKGIDDQLNQLLANTRQFAEGFSANNCLLWGARGMGKSTLVKAVLHHLNQTLSGALKLIEIPRENLASLHPILEVLTHFSQQRFILFCDDLSFDAGDASYKSLKTVLEGSIAGGLPHVLFYATSNRRHLMPRAMIENEASTAINPDEAVQEKVSLSDRFGLWLGFHSCTQEVYLDMVLAYAEYYHIPLNTNELRTRALAWSITRGGRSGRVAFQFIRAIAGETRTLLTPRAVLL